MACANNKLNRTSKGKNMFAVIKTGGKQYTVAADDLLKVEKLAGDTGDMIEFTQILMVGEGADAAIGQPFVEGALVTAEVMDQGRARKVIAFKKRRRQNSKRTRGHRQHETTIRIAEILTGGAKPSKKAAAPKKKKKDESSTTLAGFMRTKLMETDEPTEYQKKVARRMKKNVEGKGVIKTRQRKEHKESGKPGETPRQTQIRVHGSGVPARLPSRKRR